MSTVGLHWVWIQSRSRLNCLPPNQSNQLKKKEKSQWFKKKHRLADTCDLVSTLDFCASIHSEDIFHYSEQVDFFNRHIHSSITTTSLKWLCEHCHCIGSDMITSYTTWISGIWNNAVLWLWTSQASTRGDQQWSLFQPPHTRCWFFHCHAVLYNSYFITLSVHHVAGIRVHNKQVCGL